MVTELKKLPRLSITEKEVAYVASLAKISMTEADLSKFTKELGGILHWMEALNKIEIPNDVPHSIPLHRIFERPDDAPTPDCSKELMQNAPDPQLDFFGVPKVIE